MGCIDNIGVKYSKASKTRGRLITSVISLSAALMFALGLMIIMTIGIWIKWDTVAFGEFDAVYNNLTTEQIIDLSNEDDLKSVSKKINIGSTSNISLDSIDEEYIKGFNYKILKGHYPNEINEVTLSESAIKYFGLNGSIGEEVKISYKDTHGLTFTETFILSGIIKDNIFIKENNEVILISEEFALTNTNYINYLYVKKKIFVSTSDIFDIGKRHEVSNNDIGIPLSNSSMIQGLMGPSILVAGLVILLSTVSIGSIFFYTINERIKTIGLLKSIGMTKKQLKEIFNKEANQFLRKGIIYGFIIGILAFSAIVFGQYLVSDKSDSLDSLLNKLDIDIFLIKDIWIMVLVMFIITLLTVWVSVKLSISIPFRKTNKISITSSINYVPNKKIRPKRRNLLVKKIPTKLALVNFKTNKIKTIVPSIFLGLSASLFIFFTIFLKSMDANVLADQMTIGEIIVEGNVSNELLNDIKKLESVTDVGTASHIDTFIPYDNIIFNEGFLDKEEFIINQKEQNEVGVQSSIIGYNDTMLEDLGLEKLENNEVYLRDRYKYSNYNVGDKIKQVFIDEFGNEVILDFIVKGYINKSLHSNTPYIYGAPVIIVNDSNLNNIRSNYNFLGLFIDGDVDKTKEQITGLVDERHIDITTINEIKNGLYEEFFLVFSMGYGLFIVIGFLSFTMIINNIYTSITSRKKEFAILRSVGMTKSQLNNYFLWEVNIYMIFVVIISVPLGYSLAKYLITELAEQNAHFIWKFPISSLSVIVVYYAIIYIVTRIVFYKMDKFSVSELLRY